MSFGCETNQKNLDGKIFEEQCSCVCEPRKAHKPHHVFEKQRHSPWSWRFGVESLLPDHGGSIPGTASQAKLQSFTPPTTLPAELFDFALAMESSAESLVYQDSDNHVVEEWERVKVVLQENPSLMTPQILNLALRNKPPLQVIECMLSVNIRAASLPKRGPTALQCAVRYHASIDVVKCLLKACPFALLASNLDDTEFKDPLECARATRADETELIEILSKPLSFWLKESQKGKRTNDKATEQPRRRLGDSAHKAGIDSVGVIATAVDQAQERRQQTLKVHRHSANPSTTERLLEMDMKQCEHDKTQQIALEMKATAVRTKASVGYRISEAPEQANANRSEFDAREDAVLMKLEASVDEFDSLVKDWKAKTERRIRRLECKVKQASKMKDFHLTDTHLQFDYMDQAVKESDSGESSVFATSFLSGMTDDVDESEDPLFGKHLGRIRNRRFWSSTKKRMRTSTRMRGN